MMMFSAARQICREPGVYQPEHVLMAAKRLIFASSATEEDLCSAAEAVASIGKTFADALAEVIL